MSRLISIIPILIVLCGSVSLREANHHSESGGTSKNRSESGGTSMSFDGWDVRLEGLSPDRPLEYFRLAEEVADAAETDDDRTLARRLFSLAAVLDADQLGRSACLALADLEEDHNEKRRYQALAQLLGARTGSVNWLTTFEKESIDPKAALAVAQAVSFYRRGQGARAAARLQEEDGGERLFARYAEAIGGEERFRDNAQRYRSGESPVQNEAELRDLLRFQIALLAGDDRSWSSDLLLHRGRKLIEVDPDRLAETLGIDATKMIYRGGRWVEP